MNDRFADYVPVSERLEHFYTDYPKGRVLTSIVEHDAENGFVLIRAEIYRQQEDAVPSATGHAFENRSEGYVNKTSYIENCETSATGRALALLGYEIKRGIASREEMEKTERMNGGGESPELGACPECGNTNAVIRGKAEYGGGFLCFKKKGGCGAKWGATEDEKPKRATKKDVNDSRRVLIEGVADAFRALNRANYQPMWSKKTVREFVALHFQGTDGVDELEDDQLNDLLRMLSEKLDAIKNGDEKKKALIASINSNFDSDQHLANYMKDHGGKTLEQLTIPELEAIDLDCRVPF